MIPMPNNLKEAVQEHAAEMGVTPERVMEANERAERREATDEDKELLRGLVPPQKRPCGDCDLCCSAPAIEDSVLSNTDPNDAHFSPKPACQQCQFAKGKGCSIYDNRPSVCKDYQCLWSMGLIPAKHYPMKRGVAWSLQPDGDGAGILMGHCLDVDKVLDDEHTIQLIAQYVDMTQLFSGVTLRDGYKAVCFMPDGRGARAQIDQSDPMKMRVLENTEKKFSYSFGKG